MSNKTNLFKTNFSSGEISPSMGGRLDVTRHKNGAAEITNFVVRPQGGLVRRMGSIYLGEIKDSATPGELIRFQFSNNDVYVLEFGDLVLRFWKNEELIESSPGVPYEIATIYPASAITELYYAQSADVVYLTHPDYPPQTLSRFSDTNWTIANSQFDDGPYRVTRQGDRDTTLWLTDIVNSAVVTSTIAEFAFGDIGKFVEFWKDGVLIIGEITSVTNANTIVVTPRENVIDLDTLDKSAVITHASNKIRASLAIWSSETEYNYIKVDGVWYYMTTHDPIPQVVGTSPNSYAADVMNTDLALKPTMKATTGVLTFSNQIISAFLRSSKDFFVNPRDVGRQFRLNFGNRVVWGRITIFNSTTNVNVRLGNRVPTDPRNGQIYIDDATTNDWRIGAWYVGNYPRSVTLHQQRLCYAGTHLEPNRCWMSESDDYVSFATTNLFGEVLDSSGINFGIASGEVNTILWLQSGPVLLIGTLGEEYQVKPTSIGEPLTPTNINITNQTPYGSTEFIRPIKIGPSTLFVQQHGQRVRELIYNFEIDSFTAADTTIISEHIFRKHISGVDMVYQQIPNSLLWLICADGKLVCLTYEKEQQVYAWTNHELPGGFVESIITVPSSAHKQDMVYMIVRRTIDGDTKRYVEMMAPEFYPASITDKVGMVYLDCSISYSGPAITVLTGLAHLEGEEIEIIANYAVHPKRTVIGGQVDLQYPATQAYAGIGFTSRLHTLPEEGGSPTGTSHGKLKKIVRVDCQLLDSLGMKYGRHIQDIQIPRTFRETQGIMGQSPDLFTGFVELTDDSGFNKDGQFYIVQDQPYPLNILSLMAIVKVNE